MKTRAIRDLTQLSDPDLFAEISTGLHHIFTSIIGLDQDARLLAEHKRWRGCQILDGVAKEEAAKFLILLDAIRCPRTPPKTLSQHLGKFYDHLAKGIYAEACNWRPATYGELLQYIRSERQQLYLDGPNDTDWIFSNWILSSRESQLYVDYVHTDEGHYWFTPSDQESDFLLMHSPAAVQLVQALAHSGCTTPRALEVIAGIWRTVEMAEDCRWPVLRDLNRKTLEELKRLSILQEQPGEVYVTIIDQWLFPLHSVELRLITVSRADLRARQDDLIPDR